MRRLFCLALLALPGVSLAADMPNLSYSFLQADVGIGRLKLSNAGRAYDFKSKSSSGLLSAHLTPNWFVSLALLRSTADGEDQTGGIRYSLESEQSTLGANLGWAKPIGQSSDLFLQLGVQRLETDSRSKLRGVFTANSVDDKAETEMTWALGTRTLWADTGFELELALSGAKSNTSVSLGGPMYLTPQLGLDITYTYTRDKSTSVSDQHQGLTLGLRYYYH